MKRLLSIFCIAALLLGMVIPQAVRAEAVCPYCGRPESEYIPLTSSTDRFLTAAHYYLTGNVSVSKQLVQESAGISCIDLAGKTLSSSARVIQVGEDVTKPQVELNILDSVGGGQMVGKGSTAATWSAGVIYQEPGSVINVRGGTIKAVDTASSVAKKGGIATILGTFNVYGGTIQGAPVSGFGGTLWATDDAVINLAGGQVLAGSAPEGSCIYVDKNVQVTLSGNAKADAIQFIGSSADCLTVKGKYTGSATLNIAAADGSVVAKAENADLSGGSITIAGTGLAASVSGNSVIVGEGIRCEACRKNVVWQELTSGLTAGASGHYRLTRDVSAAQLTIKNGVQICLDLNGHTYAGTGRTFVLGAGYSAGAGEILNIMDSSEGKTGRLTGCGGSEAMAGGIAYVYNNTTLNIYGGTLEAIGSGKAIAKNGGVLDLYGTANIYGGRLIGNRVANNGGTVCLLSSTAAFNMEGGTLVAGKADNLGDCVYVASNGTVRLSGDAVVPEIYFAGTATSKLTVAGEYTGRTTLKYEKTPASGATIGTASGATLGKESIAIADTRNFAAVSGTSLVVTALRGAVADGIYCDTLAEALTKGTNIRLLADTGENVTVSGDVTLDLCGWNLTGNIHAEGGTLYVQDTATADHTVEDLAGYGKLTGKLTGKVLPADAYLQLSEADGCSFHHYVLKLRSANLRPGSAGIYYESDILADEAVFDKVDRYGVTVSVLTDTPTADPSDEKSLYTTTSGSVLISGILDGEATDGVDGATPVYGRPYILLKDGTYLYGKTCSVSLQKLTELVDAQKWGKLSLLQNRAITAMYGSYDKVLSSWNVPNLKKSAEMAAAAGEDGVLKAIILGNSDSTDATNLLYEIFLAEGWQKEQLVLGCMYESGCALSSHVKFAQGNMAEYKYYKNTGSNPDGTWDCREETTIAYALQDENWDIVILQDSNTVSGMANHYVDNPDVEAMITYVVNTLGYEPTLLWHFVGANPQIPEPYMSYVLNNGSADGDNSDASENEGWVDDGTTEPEDLVWIFDIARPSAPVSWAKRYHQYWNNDREVMYKAIAENVKTYILGNKNYGFDGVIPSATSFQHAINTLGMTERDMYRDYTHKSDYGRVMVSYVWYATLTGKTELQDIQFTTVPAHLRQKKFVQYGDLVLTPEQLDILLQSVNFALRSPLEAPASGK